MEKLTKEEIIKKIYEAGKMLHEASMILEEINHAWHDIILNKQDDTNKHLPYSKAGMLSWQVFILAHEDCRKLLDLFEKVE